MSQEVVAGWALPSYINQRRVIMEKFRRDHPPSFDRESGVEQTRVLALQMAGTFREQRVVLNTLRYLIPAVATVDSNVSGSGSAGYDSQASLEGGGRR